MKCEQCKRKVRNSFTDKLEHMIVYHPDHFLNRFRRVPDVSFKIGEHMGELLKGFFNATKRVDAKQASHLR